MSGTHEKIKCQVAGANILAPVFFRPPPHQLQTNGYRYPPIKERHRAADAIFVDRPRHPSLRRRLSLRRSASRLIPRRLQRRSGPRRSRTRARPHLRQPNYRSARRRLRGSGLHSRRRSQSRRRTGAVRVMTSAWPTRCPTVRSDRSPQPVLGSTSDDGFGIGYIACQA
jgi:hypothetical protein